MYFSNHRVEMSAGCENLKLRNLLGLIYPQ